DLFLVLNDGELRLAMLEHVGHLIGYRVLVDRHWNCPEALHGREGGIEARAVVADDGDRIAARERQLAQPDGEHAHLIGGLYPRPGLPEAQVLGADRGAFWVASGMAQQQLWQRVG